MYLPQGFVSVVVPEVVKVEFAGSCPASLGNGGTVTGSMVGAESPDTVAFWPPPPVPLMLTDHGRSLNAHSSLVAVLKITTHVTNESFIVTLATEYATVPTFVPAVSCIGKLSGPLPWEGVSLLVAGALPAQPVARCSELPSIVVGFPG